MLISPAPIAIPVNTANVPTEALAAEAIRRPQIPQPTSATENTANKNTTEFSDQGKSAAENNLGADEQNRVSEKEQGQKNSDSQDSNSQDQQQNAEELDIEQQAQVRQLQSRDREVRSHEQAHASVGGSLAGAPNLNFTTGPDGKRYAISGDVSIDISKVANDPAATIRKLEQVQRAALAPANPSSQDRRVASRAATSANQARSELNIQKLQESNEAKTTRGEKLEESSGANKTERTIGTSESLDSATEPGKVDLKQTSLQSNTPVNPVEGKRLAENLALRIIGSGAFAADEIGGNLSIRA